MSKWIINKIGGEGAGNPEYGKRILDIAKKQYAAGSIPWMVMSAAAIGDERVTEELRNFYEVYRRQGDTVPLINRLKKNHSTLIDGLFSEEQYREHARASVAVYEHHMKEVLQQAQGDAFASFLPHGEFLITEIYHDFFHASGFPVYSINHHETPIITNGDPKEAEIDVEASKERMRRFLYPFPKIEGGYFGIDRNGNNTILGTGGSDYKAIATQVILGLLGEDAETVLWKTTPGGVMSVDPKYVPEARTVPQLSYTEAMQAGRVIQEKACRLAQKYDAEFYVRSLIDLDNPGTRVSSEQDNSTPVKIIGYRNLDDNISAVYLVGNISPERKKRMLGVVNYTQGTFDDAVVVDGSYLQQALRELHHEFIGI